MFCFGNGRTSVFILTLVGVLLAGMRSLRLPTETEVNIEESLKFYQLELDEALLFKQYSFRVMIQKRTATAHNLCQPKS